MTFLDFNLRLILLLNFRSFLPLLAYFPFFVSWCSFQKKTNSEIRPRSACTGNTFEIAFVSSRCTTFSSARRHAEVDSSSSSVA